MPAPSTTIAERTAGSAIDYAVLDEIRDLEVFEPGLLADLLQSFLQDVPQQLWAMHAAIDVDDGAVIGRIAHKLKGSAGSLGAKRLAALCDEIQSIAYAGRCAPIPHLLETAEDEFGLVRTELNELLAAE